MGHLRYMTKHSLRRSNQVFFTTFCLFVWACSTSEVAVDGSARDTSRRDVSGNDSGTNDSGNSDSGNGDSGSSDSGDNICERIQTQYDKLTALTQCDTVEDCHIVTGECGVGLGDCYHVVNNEKSPAQLSALGQMWLDNSCGGAVCDCPAPPDPKFLICDTDGIVGTCRLGND